MNLHTAPELDETERHRLLADEQRRFVIESLQTPGGGVDTTLEEIAAHVRRTAQRSDELDEPGRRTLQCRLHHVHLPMLADAGLLEYDPETQAVRLGPSWVVTATAGTS